MVSKLLRDTKAILGEHWVAHIKLQTVTPDKLRPDGYKLNCVLLDKRTNQAVLILDNHAPFGYHIHPQASTDHTMREEIVVDSPYEAIDVFFSKAKEITHGK